MPDLFSPLTIGSRRLRNRLVMALDPCGDGSADGFVGAGAMAYYERCAHGGAGLLITEALRVVPPTDSLPLNHVGLYADVFVPQLAQLISAARSQGACVLLALAEPTPLKLLSVTELSALAEAFVLATWRAYCAGADGIMLSAVDGGLFYSQLSPLHNQRTDAYGGGSQGRQRLILEIVEEIRRWMGKRLIIGFRLLADEFTPDGLSLQDARVLAKRLTAAGVRLLDVSMPDTPTNVARFPGWLIPLANSVKRVVDVPVIGSGELDDAYLADSIIRDGSVDLVMLDKSLHLDPDWLTRARECLAGEPGW